MHDTLSIPITREIPDSAEFGSVWFELINERQAAEILKISVRRLQKFRQKGGGPRYIKLSERLVRYRRIDLKEWTDAKLRSSTGNEDQAA